MKYLYAVAAFVAVASAQANNIPTCARQCLDDATTATTSCGITEYVCQCQPDNQSKIQGAATSCVVAACGVDVALSM
jgi:hypothetical protein